MARSNTVLLLPIKCIFFFWIGWYLKAVNYGFYGIPSWNGNTRFQRVYLISNLQHDNFSVVNVKTNSKDFYSLKCASVVMTVTSYI